MLSITNVITRDWIQPNQEEKNVEGNFRELRHY